MQKKTSFLILAFVLLTITVQAQQVNAQTIEFEKIEIQVDNSGNALVSHFLIVNSQKFKEIELETLDNKNINAFDAKTNLSFSIQDNKIKIKPNNFTQKYSITVEYESDKLTSKQQQNWKIDLKFSENTHNNAIIEIRLPQNAKILKHSPQAIIFFENNSIVAEWNFSQNQNIALNAEYVFINTTANNNSTAIAGILAIATLAIGIAFIAKKKLAQSKNLQEKTTNAQKHDTWPKPEIQETQKTQTSQKQKEIFRLLSENEQKIVNELFKEDLITQRTLQVRTGFPKSTLSRTIKKLELKGLIKSNQIGNTNRIELSKDLKQGE